MSSMFWIFCCLFLCVTCQNFDIVFRVFEEKEVGYVIGNILEKSGIPRSDIKFVLMTQEGNSYANYFYVNETSGDLKVAQVIDREIQCKFREPCDFPFEVAAQTTSDGSFFEVIAVTIVVDDINDHFPTFPEETVQYSFSEATPVNSAMPPIKGIRDSDKTAQFSIKTFELVPNHPGEFLPFKVSFTHELDGSSTVKLIVSERLDREAKDSYSFNIVAKDGGSPPLTGTLPVTVNLTDDNDNFPQFDKPTYNITIREDVEINTVILNFTATDPDLGKNGEVKYKLSDIQADLDKFSIHETKGELMVTGKLAYKENGYRLIVEAADQGDSPLTTQTYVTVNVLDIRNDPPQIYVNLMTGKDYATASEYANIGAVVAHVTVTDQDTNRNGDVVCTVISDWFSLQRYDDNEFKVIVSASLDRERHATHDVTVRCNDKGNPPLGNETAFTVKILDENDNEPRFMQQRYFANISENNEIGDSITSVSAFDFDAGDNGKIEYKMAPASEKYAFVNPHTGDVMANWIFDRENMTEVNLTVYANDKGKPSLKGSTVINVVVKDRNDHTPIFTETSFRRWVGENMQSDTTVTPARITANDGDEGDNGFITYKIKPSNNTVPFVVFQDGLIKTDRELDREGTSEYTFEVIATDKGTPPKSSSALVTVYVEDANDNEPKIEYPALGNDTVNVPYLTSPLTVIFNVIATDADEPSNANSKLTYSMVTLNTTNFFSIDSNNGDIILVAPLSNADLIDKVYILNISVKDVSDNPLTSTALLRVQITADNGTIRFMEEEPNSNFVIAIIVLSITVVIAAGIIITICFLRRVDNRRSRKDAREKVLAENMYSKNLNDSDLTDGGFQPPLDGSYQSMDNNYQDNGYQEKKKKEVSFSLEDAGMMEVQNPVPNDALPHHPEDINHIILKPPQEYLTDHEQYNQLHIPKRHDDAHSDMSGDSAGDSGKGGSDDDLHSPVGLGHDDISRSKNQWDQRRSKSPAPLQLQSLSSRYQQPAHIPNQRIIPFSFKNSPTYSGSSGSLSRNSRGPVATNAGSSAYSVPLYYDDESRSSGFQSVDSNSNLNINGNRPDGLYTFSSFRGSKPPDCVV